MSDIPDQPHPLPVVRALIDNAEGRILLLRRAATEYGQGQWCLPGGKVDYGRTVEAALAQEIREETSLQLLSAEFLFFQDSLPLHPGGMHCINFYFHCQVSGELKLNAESSEYAWIGPAETSNYNVAFGNAAAIRRHFQNRV